MRTSWADLAAVMVDHDGDTMPLSYLLGPILVGVLVNSFVYGVVFLHWVQYSLGRNQDGVQMRTLVNWCFTVDTTHTAASLWAIWYLAVQNFADVSSLTPSTWPVVATPLFVALTSTPIQLLFSWRIKQFTHSWWLFAVIVALSATSGALGILTAISGLTQRPTTISRSIVPLTDSWLAAAMICDVILAILLYTHLLKSKTGFRNTDTVIGRLMRSSVETTGLSALFAILYLLTFSIVPKTNFHIIFSLPLGRIYNGTLLSTLNSRTTLREELYGASTLGGDRLNEAFQITERMRRLPTEVAINVEQEVQMERLEEVDFKQFRKAPGVGTGVPVGVATTPVAIDGKEDFKIPDDLNFEAV